VAGKRRDGLRRPSRICNLQQLKLPSSQNVLIFLLDQHAACLELSSYSPFSSWHDHCVGLEVSNFIQRNHMPTILWVVLILLLLGALPLYPYSSGWGYYPSGGLGLLLIILVLLAVFRGGSGV
jgi:hypothetical protein